VKKTVPRRNRQKLDGFGGFQESVGKGETADKGEDLAGRVDRPVWTEYGRVDPRS
jgi:hypothetical protein